MGTLLQWWGVIQDTLTWVASNTLLVGVVGIWLLLMGMLPFAVPNWVKLLTWPLGYILGAFLAFYAGEVGQFSKGERFGRDQERLLVDKEIADAREELRRKAAQEAAERQRRIDELEQALAQEERSLVEFLENSSAEGEESARRMIQLIERIRAQHEAEMKQAQRPVAPVLDVPPVVQCEKANVPVQCPPVPACPPPRQCVPALLQRVPDEFVR